MSNMFCYQCEQTVQGTGCVKAGACGKSRIPPMPRMS